MHRKSAGLFVLTGVLAAAVNARGSAVPISYSEQDRSVSASSSVTGVARGGTASTPVTHQQSQSKDAKGFGVFSGNVSAKSSLGSQGGGSSGSASQQSSLGKAGFSASGSVTADSVFGNTGGPVNGAGSSLFKITFNVTQLESYIFTANLSAITDPGSPAATISNIQLTDASGANLFTPITAVKVSDFTDQGLLTIGTYSFTLDTQVASDDENLDSINYNISLATGSVESGPVSGTGPTGSSAVPLPSSGLTALVMLSCLGIAGVARRRLPVLMRVGMS